MSAMIRSFAVACGVMLFCTLGAPAMARESGPRASAPQAIDVLKAEAQGLVTVKYIPNDARSAQILVRNTSKRPLTLRLPAAFAGIPLLAQMGGGQGAGFGAGGIGGAPQTTGGGAGMGGMGGGGMGGMGGMGGGAFSIPPEATRTLRVATVCLEHGKPEPNTRHPYKLAELESFSADPNLAIVMERFGRGELPQKVAQAAAWHLASGLSWEQLAAEKIDHAGGVPDEPYFSPAELMAAQRAVALTMRATEQVITSPTE